MHRVAVIGATGYAGQELVRILARHPAVDLTLATASQATSTPRQLPALARVWDGEVRPLDLDTSRAEADVAFLALPEAASAEVAPALLDAGLRVVDLSGAFRLRDGRRADALVSGDAARCRTGVAYGLTEFERDGDPRARGSWRTRAAIRRRRCLRCCRCSGPACSPPSSDIVIDAKSGISGAGKAPTERTHFSENHGSVAAYGAFGHRHTPEMEQALGRQVTFVPHLVPLDRGILSSHYVRLVPGTTGGAGRGGVRVGVRDGAVRAPDRHRSARDQARGVDQLLRHRLEGRRGNRARARRGGDRQPREGRGGIRRAELQRDVRHRRMRGTAVTRAAATRRSRRGVATRSACTGVSPC